MLVEGNATAAGRNRCSESSNGILFVVRETAATQPSSSTADTNPTTESKGGSASSSSGASIVAGGGGGYGGMGSDGGGVEVDGEPSRLVTVRNLRPRRRVVVAVVNVSMYFSVTPVPTRCLGAGSEDPAAAAAAATAAATDDAGAVFPRRDHSGGGGTTLGFRGWGQGLGAAGVAGGIELFDVPAGESLTLRVTPRLDKLRSGTGLALLANEQSLEVRSGGR